MTKQKDKLARIFKNMDADACQEIRDAYYKTMEGLHTLARSLEIADADQSKTAGPLLDEHFIALEAIEAMDQSDLGRIL